MKLHPQVCGGLYSILLIIVAGIREEGVHSETEPPLDSKYGVDTSFPIHHQNTIQDGSNPLNAHSKRQLYKEFIQGCETKYSSRPHACLYNEKDRIDMNLNQPKSMFVSATNAT